MDVLWICNNKREKNSYSRFTSRSRFEVNNRPVVEFHMKYFDV